MEQRPVIDVMERLPLLGRLARRVRESNLFFNGSVAYWDQRYRRGGTSGRGSYHELAAFKAEILNAFVARHRIQSIIEFGCGDGNQVKLACYPKYLGLDVSETAINLCRDKFADDPSMEFRLVRDYRGETADVALSLDVIYHLVEDDVYEHYMRRLFDAAEAFVIIYSSNTERNGILDPHIRHRRFTSWVRENRPDWVLVEHIRNRYPLTMAGMRGSFADFYIYQAPTWPR